MSEPFIGEIREFGFDFAPVGWLPCQGQQVSISEYDTLFALLGTTFGGDGIKNFGIPDLRGRVPVGFGAAPGIITKYMGQMLGYEQITLTQNEIPSHTHSAQTETTASSTVYAETATSDDPTGRYFGKPSTNIFIDAGRTPQKMANNAIIAQTSTIVGNSGGNGAHYNIQPSIVVSFCIAYKGYFPPRT